MILSIILDFSSNSDPTIAAPPEINDVKECKASAIYPKPCAVVPIILSPRI